MKPDARIDLIESRLNALDRKVWLILIIGAVLFIKGSDGALMSVLTGASIASGVTTMEPAILLGLAAAAGSAFRAWIGYVAKYKKKGIDFDWGMFLISVLPTAVAGLAAGMGFDLELNLQNIILVFLGAAGINSLQDKFGLQKKLI